MDAEQFSLKWNNFHSNLATGFHDLLRGEDLVDVTLAVDGQVLQAHKLVLSVCSPYFKQMFKIQPERHPICILKGVTYSDLSNILQFMYQGEVNVRQEDLANFLKTAELLQVKGLTDNEPQFQYESPPDPPVPIPLPIPIQTKQKPKIERTSSPYCSPIITEPTIVDLAPSPPPVAPVLVPPQNNTENKRPAPAPTRTHSNNKRPRSDINDLSPPESVDATKTEPIDLESDDYDDTSPALDDGLQQFFDSQKDSLSSSMLAMSSTLHESNLSEQDWIRTTSIAQGLQVQCSMCDRIFANKYNLRVHVRDKHEIAEHSLKCVICSKPMRNQSCLRVHMYQHKKILKNESSLN